MQETTGNTTVPGASEERQNHHSPAPRDVPTLVIAWYPAEPHRVGEAASLHGQSSWMFGRGDDESSRERVRFGRQRPSGFTETGTLENKALSRRHLLFTPRHGGLEVVHVGKKELLVNGVVTKSEVLATDDVIEIEGVIVLLLTSRPETMVRRGVTEEDLGPFGEPDANAITGESPAAADLREQIEFAAASDAHVILTGESGTGKELTAHAIHAKSSRAAERFIARSAATFPTELIIPELFGHPKNFPNAGMPERPGIIGQAHKGTAFLDEIGELPHAMQAPLLRVLDRAGEYHRVGETEPRHADIRFIGATNRPLSALKHDLLARLTVQIELPSLNERREDIPLLVRQILRRRAAASPKIAQRFVDASPGGSGEVRLAPAFVVHLLRHHYTTNIRELDALLWKSMMSSKGDRLDVPPAPPPPEESAVDIDELLGGIGAAPAATVVPDDGSLAGVSDEQIKALLVKNRYNVAKTAAELGQKSRHALDRRIKKMKAEGKL